MKEKNCASIRYIIVSNVKVYYAAWTLNRIKNEIWSSTLKKYRLFVYLEHSRLFMLPHDSRNGMSSTKVEKMYRIFSYISLKSIFSSSQQENCSPTNVSPFFPIFGSSNPIKSPKSNKLGENAIKFVVNEAKCSSYDVLQLQHTKR